ncbi:MAG: acyl-CoA dehydrogenase family protein [Bacteriovoracaceae bacterium]|nr:acyl-CoA dehydrogenase family protein [Bacteriovoracaceae bacterium]
MMDDLEQELQQQLKRFRLEQIEPYALEDDENSHFRMEIFSQLGQLGFAGVTLPEQYGGVGLSYQTLCVILCEIAQSSVAYAVTISVSTMVQSIINEYGNKSQKEKYLPPLTSGEAIGAFSLTESQAGSDAAALRTTAKKTDEGYILNGCKMFVTSGGIAKTYIVMAKTADSNKTGISAFIVEDGTPGFSYGKKEKKMGWRSSPTTELIFENCTIPHENLLWKEGKGLKIALSALDRGRITIGAIATGLATAALEHSLKFALERKQFNKSIFNFEGISFMLADMATEIEASKLLVYQAANLYDRKKNNQKLASMAKLKATDTAMKVTTDAVQILGGVGYTKEFPVERFMRDAKVLQIVEGTNQIQRLVISRNLKKEYE